MFVCFLFACAVNSFPLTDEPSGFDTAGRNLLSTETQRWRGFNPWNDKIDEDTVKWAAYAAEQVYRDGDCKTEDWKHGDWKCKRTKEYEYKYWFKAWASFLFGTNDDTFMGKIRFHLYWGPGNKCGVVFRGTKSTEEWYTNLKHLLEDPVSFGGELVHPGYKQAFDGWPTASGNWEGAKMKSDLTFYLTNEQYGWKQQCEGGVYFVGHSLGGAMATIADIWYKENWAATVTNGKKATTITFGAPPVVYKNTAANTVQDLRIFHTFDIVAADYNSYEHRGPAKIISCPLSEYTSHDPCSMVWFQDGGEQSAATWVGAHKHFHSMSNYKRYVNANLEPLKEEKEMCFKDEQCESNSCEPPPTNWQNPALSHLSTFCRDPDRTWVDEVWESTKVTICGWWCW